MCIICIVGICNEAYTGVTCHTQIPFTFSAQLVPNSRYCYAMDKSKIMKSQSTAASFCTGGGGRLASVQSAAEHAAVMCKCSNKTSCDYEYLICSIHINKLEHNI